MNRDLIFLNFPYLSVLFRIGALVFEVDALLDTGYEGGLAVPSTVIGDAGVPAGSVDLEPAVGDIITAPFYEGVFQVGNLGPFPVRIDAVGNEALIGQRAIAYFSITLDHGRRVIVSP